MPRTRPWLRLDAQYDRDAKVRKSRAAAIWPAVLCRLKPGGGRCSADDLDAELLAADLHLPLELVEPMVEGLFRVGLLELDGDEVLTPGWAKYQEVDTRPHSRSRKPADSAYSQNVPASPKVPKCPKDRTGQDRTGQESPVGDSHARAGEAGGLVPPTETVTDDPPDGVRLMNALGRALKDRRQWTHNEQRNAVELIQKYGIEACLQVAATIDVADSPVAMLRRRLDKSGTRPPGGKKVRDMTDQEYVDYVREMRRER